MVYVYHEIDEHARISRYVVVADKDIPDFVRNYIVLFYFGILAVGHVE